jgi:DNA repair protein RadC
MKPIKELSAFDRPREKIVRRGPEALKDRELVAAIIGNGIRGRDVGLIAAEIARLIQEKGVGIQYRDLMAIRGVGEVKACQILASFELARRHLVRETATIAAPEDVLPLVADLLDKKQEHFVCLTLNGAGELIAKRTITVGLLNHSPVHPREVYADAITDRAASVICVHNHPSGDPKPSEQDIAVTRQLAQAGTLLGIRMLDHIIVGKKGHASLKAKGFLD